MKKLLLTLSLVAMLPAASAHAIIVTDPTVDINLATLGSSIGPSVAPNVNLQTSASLGSGSLIVGSPDPSNPTSFGTVTAPEGTLYGGNYLAVLNNGSASLNLAPNTNAVGFTWGTIDTENTVTIKDSAGNSFVYTGTEFKTALANLGYPTALESDVQFVDPLASIVSVILTSSGNPSNSFEIANVSAVPLPGSLIMMATALLALFAWRRRKVL